MKVRAKQTGQYKGVVYHPGDIFEIEDGSFPQHQVDDRSNIVRDKDGVPVVVEIKSHLEDWMEQVEPVKPAETSAEPVKPAANPEEALS